MAPLPQGRDAFQGLYALAERRRAKLESGGTVFNFGGSALLRAEAPLPDWEDAAQMARRLAEWSGGFLIMAHPRYADIALDLAADMPIVTFLVLGAQAPDQAPPNCHFAVFDTDQALFAAGALVGGLLAGKEGASGVYLGRDGGGSGTFADGLDFAVGQGNFAFQEIAFSDAKGLASATARAMKADPSVIIAGEDFPRDQARALSAKTGAFLIIADGGAPDALKPAPLAWVEERMGTAAALTVEAYLDAGAAGFRPPLALGLAEGCVALSIGEGFEGLCAPHAGLLDRATAEAARHASTLKPDDDSVGQ
jgi:hypothetical protein